MATLPFSTVNNENELNLDLVALAGEAGSYTITFGSSFTLANDLLAVNLAKGGSLTLQGAGNTIDGGNRFRGLFDYAGVLTVNNLTIANARASGGNGGQGSPNGGGGGGGGAGLGGGLFVAPSGNTTLNNVTFANDSAVGGNGGAAAGPSSEADGGGGGLGGDGGNGRQVTRRGEDAQAFGGSGGGIGTSATGGSLQPGGPGLIPSSPTARIGGGGGVGLGANDFFPTGGGINPDGLFGGFGGGGGGNQNGRGADGGFGGGGAGGGRGGFGGGGGGDTVIRTGGFGAGSGGTRESPTDPFPGGGGGGLGAGGDIFVAQGGGLTIGGVALNAGSVAGGVPGSQNSGRSGSVLATGGHAFGNGIFIQGNQSITFAPPTGTTTTISSTIADMNGSLPLSGGAGGVIMGGAGTLKLAVGEPYTGATRIGSGTLELANPNAAGTGNIVFGGAAPGGPAVLRIDTVAAPTNVVTGLGTGDTIDFAALPYMAGASAAIINNKLTVTSGAQTVTMAVLSPNATLAVGKDATGGTNVDLFFPVVTNEQEFNRDLKAIAGSTTAQKITIGGSFHLIGPLLAVNLGTGGSLTIDGGGFALSGRGLGSQRGLFVYAGNVTIENLALNDMLARGGNGGSAANPGGGGAGLGGGLFVASGGNVTLDNVSFSGDKAIGGDGGGYRGIGFAGGGGGGLGGLGGGGLPGVLDFTSDGGGGGVGLSASGGALGTRDGRGNFGIVPGTASGGNGGQGILGGIDGGGGGSAGRGDGGGGGIGGQAGNSAGNFGGNGGFGGGGGGGGSGFFDSTNGGGSGGFGGGAGGGANTSHTGGFGGGGGGGGDNPGVPGFGGGFGGGSNFGGGGGGGGFGGDIFVQEGGSLTIKGGTLGAGTVAGGTGGAGRTTPSNNGQAGGSGGTTLFEQGNQKVTFAPDAGETLTVEGTIADENAFSPRAGAGGVVVSGAGVVRLVASNSYTGGTALQSGTLELVTKSSAGTGAITFGDSGASIQTLQLDYVRPGITNITQSIARFGTGASRIYLPNLSLKDIAFVSDVGDRLVFRVGGATHTFSHIDEIAGDTINATSFVADPSGKGVDIVPVPAAGDTALEATVLVSRCSALQAVHGGDGMAFLGGTDASGNATIVEQAHAMQAFPMISLEASHYGAGTDFSTFSDLLFGAGGETLAADPGVNNIGRLFPTLGGGQWGNAAGSAPLMPILGNRWIGNLQADARA